MSNLKDALDKKKGDSTPLLTGSVLPRKQSTITLMVTGVREAPESFNSPAIMDFQPVTIDKVEYGAIPLNKTNTKLLLETVGNIELEDIQGEAVFQRLLVNNPQTKTLTQGLQLISFRAKKVKATKPKAGPASRKGGRRVAGDNDLPF